MGITTGSGTAVQLEENRAVTLELVHIQADVWPDGSTAILSLHTKAGQMDLTVPFDQMQAATAELGEAGNLMLRRQMQAGDKGRSAFAHLMLSAPRPVAVSPIIDRATGDVVFVYRFADRLPLSVRVTMEQIIDMRGAFEAEVSRNSH